MKYRASGCSILNYEFPGELFRGTQDRTEIAELLVDLVGSLDGLGNFFAEQRAIALAQPVNEAFH